ncbi:MAG: ispE [Acidobacteria bacterium]|nr:ispE [Acidobacteriota bacterium]
MNPRTGTNVPFCHDPVFPIFRLMEQMRLDALAKINLTLRVLERRPDGYHRLRTVFQSIALHDTLEFQVAPGPFTIECDDPSVPVDGRNLVWRAASLAWQAAGRPGEPAGVRVRLRKRIPAQGGLGGGSADAAAAVAAFTRLWPAREGASSREAIARRLGADVPFFLCGGTALGEGRGDDVTPLADLPLRHVVLVFPPFGVPTAEAYGWLDEDRAAGKARAAPRHALRLADGAEVEVANDLEAPVVARHPEIGRARDALLAAGAEAAAMSGSGSAVFGLFPAEAAAAAAAEGLRSAGWRAALSRTAGRERALRFLV